MWSLVFVTGSRQPSAAHPASRAWQHLVRKLPLLGGPLHGRVPNGALQFMSPCPSLTSPLLRHPPISRNRRAPAECILAMWTRFTDSTPSHLKQEANLLPRPNKQPLNLNLESCINKGSYLRKALIAFTNNLTSHLHNNLLWVNFKYLLTGRRLYHYNKSVQCCRLIITWTSLLPVSF